MPHRFIRHIRAQLRDVYVLFQEFRSPLLLFVIIVLGGAALLHLFYTYPGGNEHPSYSEALHAAFSMVFFEIVLPYPARGSLQLLFFLIPILGLAVVADGVLRFGSALVSKQARGQKWQIAMASTFSNHIIVCGVGKVGYRVILELQKFDREVVALEIDPEARFVEKVQQLDTPLILADARRPENLKKAGVAAADAIIPCTNDELTNLDIALDARELNPEIKVVMRMFDSDLARRVETGFGIHTAFSTSALAAPIFASAAMRLNVRHSFYLGDVLLLLSELEIKIGSRLNGWTVERLEREYDLSVICFQSQGTPDLHPEDEQVLEASCRILVLATLATTRNLHKLNTPVV